MTFAALVEKIASETGETKKMVHDILTETVAISREGLENDGSNSLPNFGRFSLKWHKARKGRNPKSGEIIDIAAHNTVIFRTQPSLKEHINRKFSNFQVELIEPKKEIASKEIAETYYETSPHTEELEIPQTIMQVDIPQHVIEVEEPLHIIETKVPQPVVEKKPDPLTEMSKREIKHVQDDKDQAIYKGRKSPSQEKKKHNGLWLWLLALLLIILIILAYFFWPLLVANKLNNKRTTETSGIQNNVGLAAENTSNELLKPIEEKTESAIQTPITEDKIINTNPLGVDFTFPATNYKVKINDYLYDIARNHYNAPALWPLIYRANRANVLNPELIMPGIEIILPAVQGNKGNLAAQDKKNLAEGYMEIYLYYKNIDRRKALYHLWVVKELDISILNNNLEKINKEDIKAIEKFNGKILL